MYLVKGFLQQHLLETLFLAVYIIFSIAYFFITDAVIFPEIEELSPAENKFIILVTIIFRLLYRLIHMWDLYSTAFPSNKSLE